MKVPPFLLRRLYVKGSLKNTPGGFQFQLKNQLGSGYARRLMPITVDGVDVPLEATSFTTDGKEVPLTAVAEGTPFTLALNKVTTLTVQGKPLAPGPRKIGMRFEVAGLGLLEFDFTDVPTDG
ncbi:MAG: hypothetical protein HYY00_09690 [Chloroflexi bacterium]|nr:hypothetical protein [Chloroflexota bacterium]